MPRSAPTSTASASGRASRSACASASAGIRWPPVPPPAKRTFTASLPRRPPGAPLAHADEHPRRNERDEQTRSAVGHEGKRDPGGGEHGQGHADVQDRPDADDRGERRREQLSERIARRAGDPETEPDEQAESHG